MLGYIKNVLLKGKHATTNNKELPPSDNTFLEDRAKFQYTNNTDTSAQITTPAILDIQWVVEALLYYSIMVN